MSQKKILLLIILANVCLAGWAQYRIDIRMTGANDSLIAIVRYTAQGRTTFQSKRADSGGNAVFEDHRQNLAAGMYVAVVCGEEFPFLVSNSGSFELTITADKNNAEALAYSRSRENEDFLKYLNYQKKYNSILQKAHYNYQRGSSEIRAEINDLLDTLHLEQEQFAAIVTGSHPNSLLKSVITASQELDREHYFDNVDFNDNRLINTPVLSARLTTFFKQIMARETASSITAAANVLLERAEGSREMYRYLLTWLYYAYSRSPVEGHFAAGKAMTNLMADSAKVDWLTEADKRELQTNLKRYLLNPVGSIAADLALQTMGGMPKSLHSVKASCTLLYFFNPECQACRVITPLLYALFLKYREKGLRVFAVYPERNAAMWERYIGENGFGDFINVWDANGTADIYEKYGLYAIPQIYVLDGDKKILYKDVSIDDLQNILFVAFLNREEGQE